MMMHNYLKFLKSIMKQLVKTYFLEIIIIRAIIPINMNEFLLSEKNYTIQIFLEKSKSRKMKLLTCF